jgi:hypothetical protein
MGAAALALVLITVAGWPVYVRPQVDTPSSTEPADVIVALGGLPEVAFYADSLFRDGVAKRLLLSNPYGVPPWGAISPLCADPRPRVTCFVPSPGTTRGEAQEIGRLAAQNGWDDVIVVAPTFHISRARMIVQRCYTGRLRMVELRPHRTFLWWPWEYVYQTFGYAKAAVLRGC